MPPPATPPEILAPAGNWDCVRAAVANGAHAVYFGLDQFNARMRADNFTRADLASLVPFLHHQGVKAYVTMNVLIFPAEMAQACAYLDSLDAAGWMPSSCRTWDLPESSPTTAAPAIGK